MIRAVLFDIDGVIIDSKEANAVFFQNLLESCGYKRPSKEEVYACFSISMLQTIRVLTKEKSEEKVLQILEKGKVFDYPFNLLEYDKDEDSVIADLSKKYSLGIVTSRVKNRIKEVLEVAQIKTSFDTIVGFGDYSKSKPDPEPLLVASKALGLKPQQCIYIGDSDVDVEAAHAAKMPIIGYSKDELRGADLTVYSFKNIPAAISKLDTDD